MNTPELIDRNQKLERFIHAYGHCECCLVFTGNYQYCQWETPVKICEKQLKDHPYRDPRCVSVERKHNQNVS